MKIIIVIPARYKSSRFPGKPLALIGSTPMIVHVLQQACKARMADEVLVATDDERIFTIVTNAGGTALMTNPELPSGTDRVSAALAGREADIVVNLQGDEPLINPTHIDLAIKALLETPSAQVSTLATPVTDLTELWNPNAVKVLLDHDSKAIYFSRTPIPQPATRKNTNCTCFLRHVGLYVYRRNYLDKFITLTPSWSEETERLEQLRILHYGGKITVRIIDQAYPGVDTPDDLVIIKQIMTRQGLTSINQELHKE
ncbi:3-deoxy-manno-octulosonate cytidylyltransferase [bacterium]|nr:3-deoxy-manno-octulosonate cytidylyltransferase [bacterium]